MKTTEFINKFKELGLGYDVTMSSDKRHLQISKSSAIFATVSTLDTNSINTGFVYTVSPELFDLIVEYAKTPIEEREEQKKYYLKLKTNIITDGTYLCRRLDKYYFISNNAKLPMIKDIFTQQEIDELKKQYNLDAFEQVEVK